MYGRDYTQDELAQLRWSILEEKQRVVHILIDRVIIERVNGPDKRKITPILALDLLPESIPSAPGYQPLEYIEAAGQLSA